MENQIFRSFFIYFGSSRALYKETLCSQYWLMNSKDVESYFFKTQRAFIFWLQRFDRAKVRNFPENPA